MNWWVSSRKPFFLTKSDFDDSLQMNPGQADHPKTEGFAVSGCLKVVGLLETWADLVFEHGL